MRNNLSVTLVALVVAVLALAIGAPATAAGDGKVTGRFLGNGQAAKLAHVSASKGQPSDGKQNIMLVFTEQDHSSNDKPDISASFGKFGSALIVTVDANGDIVGCEVTHLGHKKQGFSSIGKMQMKDFKATGAALHGRLTTGGPVETFGEKWEVDLTFDAKLR